MKYFAVRCRVSGETLTPEANIEKPPSGRSAKVVPLIAAAILVNSQASLGNRRASKVRNYDRHVANVRHHRVHAVRRALRRQTWVGVNVCYDGKASIAAGLP